MFRLFRRIAGALRLAIFYCSNELIRVLIPYSAKQSSLVVRMDAIGDFIIWLSAGAGEVAEFARQRGRTVILAKKEWADFAKKLGLYDQVWAVDVERFKRDPIYRILLQIRIRASGFSEVIQPRASREFLLEDSIIRVSGAKTRIGSSAGRHNISRMLKRISDKWYTQLINVPFETEHELERGKVFCRILTGKEPIPININFDPLTSLKFGILGRDYFVIAPGAGWTGRCWPAERFAKIAYMINRESGFLCIVVGGAFDSRLVDPIRLALGDQLIDLTGKTDLLETGALLKQSRFVITNESSVSHYAPFVGVNSIVLLGGGHFGWFMPYKDGNCNSVKPISIFHQMDCFGCDWKCKFEVPIGGPVRCIDSITADEVWISIKSNGLLE